MRAPSSSKTSKARYTGASSILVLLAVLLINTLRFSPEPDSQVAQVSIAVDAERVSENLSRAIRFPTIATGDEATQEHASFREFANWAEQTYPEVYQAMQLEMIEEHTILLKWQGADPTLKPILLTAHYLANY